MAGTNGNGSAGSGVFPIIGMSPGNSYFKDGNVRDILASVMAAHGRAALMVADVPAIRTYEALGYSHHDARNKAIPKGNNLKNRVRRIAGELGLPDGSVRIVDWAGEVENNAAYLKSYSDLEYLMSWSESFSAAVDRTTGDVLLNSGKIEDGCFEEAVATGRHYLMAELAFLQVAPSLLHCTHVAYVYHRRWPVYEALIAGLFDGVHRPYLHFSPLPARGERLPDEPEGWLDDWVSGLVIGPDISRSPCHAGA